MPKPIKIQDYGDQMLIIMDDGTKFMAVPTVGGLWYIDDLYTPPPPPPPPDPPAGGGARFQWPFDPRKAPWAGGVPGGTVTSEYGPRNGRVHQGIDMAPGEGTPIPAAAAGRIVYLDAGNGGFGYHARIDHGGGLTTVYGHMIRGSGMAGNGSQVNKGQHIGRVGNTGNSFGAHLHWETHEGPLNWNNPGSHRNPRDFMAKYQG
jgi:murein DD-endopeptidase MepM/ murein hydrolase activator NlpD